MSHKKIETKAGVSTSMPVGLFTVKYYKIMNGVTKIHYSLYYEGCCQ